MLQKYYYNKMCIYIYNIYKYYHSTLRGYCSNSNLSTTLGIGIYDRIILKWILKYRREKNIKMDVKIVNEKDIKMAPEN